MTAKDLSENIGRRGTVSFVGLDVPVTVIDAKVSYGRARYQVHAGDPQRQTVRSMIWVDATRVKFEGKEC